MRSAVKHLRREQLIEATISIIARRGFARTTLALVAREVGLSQGIVSFYFKSKDGLLFETLSHLAAEYEATWKRAVRQVGPDPVAALDAVIEVDLGLEICVRKKVAVWVAFWAEAPGRPKYRKLCMELSADYFAQTRDMCRQIAERGGYADIDPDNVARGLNAMVDGYWVSLMMDPRKFDRARAKQACRQLLAGAFPAEFGPLASGIDMPGASCGSLKEA
ncbi:MAG: TetR family transcriptional regulator C-terminal domain-containing protein [Proteobacteria bacterium]|nr:TetR family transcriptional regulator C-terminal domain-containing protein [Pseudomonadota bacterium]